MEKYGDIGSNMEKYKETWRLKEQYEEKREKHRVQGDPKRDKLIIRMSILLYCHFLIMKKSVVII